MNLELRGVENVGDLERERVVLRATSDNADIGKFAIFKCRPTSDGGVASGHIVSAFWFPDRKIKKGDFVVLYTKEGTSSEKSGTNSTSYFYYWGWKEPQWKNYIAALVGTSNWDFSEKL